MTPPLDPTAARLLAATRRLLEEQGPEAVTTRAIAAAAEANLAAVNYHFRSKEALVEAALTAHLDEWLVQATVRLEEELTAGPTSAVALERVVDAMLAELAAMPRLLVAHLHSALTRQDYAGRAVGSLNSFLDVLLLRLTAGRPPAEVEARRASIAAGWSVLLLNALLPNLWDEFLGQGVRTEAGRRRLSALAAALLLSEPPATPAAATAPAATSPLLDRPPRRADPSSW